MSRTYVETSTYLLEEVDEMIQEGFYHDRSEAVNEALRMLIKQYKVSKLHAKDQRYSSDRGDRRDRGDRHDHTAGKDGRARKGERG